jgi:S-DNA-T family DNA segregation ATPase FtsK/SpoIIIE
VEFPVYNELPHLLTPVIYDAQKSVNALKWLIEEMERRFEVLAQERSRDIISYNEKMISQEADPMPYIVLIVDELADLMAARGREMEAGVVRLAQMARAVGIHLILATQRPSVEVITGLIKANVTSRITFQVASQVDSRTVLDTAGAEKLLGLGDLLFISAEMTKPKRIQGSFVSDKEVKRVAKYIKTEAPQSSALPELKGEQSLDSVLQESGPVDFFGGEDDPLFEEAKKVVIEAKKASASLLQRRLRVGYARAARLIDMLEEKGVVGPGEGAKPREILMADDSGEPGDWQKV